MMINIDIYTSIIPVVLTVAVVAVLFYVVSRDLKSMTTASGRVITEYVTLRCPSCGYVKVREFRIGDYVGKVDEEEKCPNDGSGLVIIGIGKEKAQES